ncbi:high mobility group B protein 9-like [Phoenix dactylifera]|uniref:High mobility group B protein 9-like n=1 Tax=Phoenix dactylifera TaxID=42345 RepID=A0A8B8IYQ4_PHODC|nr:high mobility group B protein 9-like [Phoenix dactylifera]
MLGELEENGQKGEELDKGKKIAEEEDEEMKENRAMVEKRQDKLYPAPLVSHQEVVRDRSVFMDSLRQFHAAMGTKFMVPVIGGKDLDLHLLYILVTQKGGIEKVIVEKKWREVISAFNFPRTTTSASFVLRKYYLSLLHQYEQVYFFGAQGPLISPSGGLMDCLQTKTLNRKLDQNESVLDPARRKRTLSASSFVSHLLPPMGSQQTIANGNGLAAFASIPLASAHEQGRPAAGKYNLPVTGRIIGKFEHGYFVTVNTGSQALHGILYHAPQPSASSSIAIQSNAIVPYAPQTQSRRRKRRRRNRDPDHPKPNRSAYNFFFAEKHAKLKVLHPNRERDFSKMIGEAWNQLTEEERKVYDEHGRRDKERYRREKQEYKERLKVAQTEAVSAKFTWDKPSQVNSEG